MSEFSTTRSDSDRAFAELKRLMAEAYRYRECDTIRTLSALTAMMPLIGMLSAQHQLLLGVAEPPEGPAGYV